MRPLHLFVLSIAFTLPAHAQEELRPVDILSTEADTFARDCVSHLFRRADLRDRHSGNNHAVRLPDSQAKVLLGGKDGAAWTVKSQITYVAALSNDNSICRIYANPISRATAERDFDWLAHHFFSETGLVPLDSVLAGPNDESTRSHGYYSPLPKLTVATIMILTTFSKPSSHGFSAVFTVKIADPSIPAEG